MIMTNLVGEKVYSVLMPKFLTALTPFKEGLQKVFQGSTGVFGVSLEDLRRVLRIFSRVYGGSSEGP